MKFNDFFFLLLQKILPKKRLSKLFGQIASYSGLASNLCKRIFICIYKIDLEEANPSNLENYQNLNTLFSRRLKPKNRPQPDKRSIWTSPADGRLTQFGEIKNGTVIQAKGITYGIKDLMGGDDLLAKDFKAGSFGCVYLAPHNYHRVHMPYDGALIAARYIPGELFSVNERTTTRIDKIFCQNERVVLIFKNESEYFAIILVGACLVGGIAVVLPEQTGKIRTHIPSHEWPQNHTIHPAASEIQRGTEIGFFYFGSTVVLLTSREFTNWAPGLTEGTEIQVGDPLS